MLIRTLGASIKQEKRTHPQRLRLERGSTLSPRKRPSLFGKCEKKIQKPMAGAVDLLLPLAKLGAFFADVGQ